MAEKPGVLVIGPLQAGAGGVATHIRNLQQLQAFAGATFYDPGSINSQQRQRPHQVLWRLYRLRALVERKKFAKILINTSVFPFAFGKLLLTLQLLPMAAADEIHVFFHGGRFSNSALYRNPRHAVHYRRLLTRASCCYFLSPQQKQQFEQRFPGITSALYRNYSTTDTTVSNTFDSALPLRLLFVGRIIAAKGVFELIAAVERLLAPKHDNSPVRAIHLRIVGDGEDLPALQRRAAALVAGGAVEFTGYLQGDELDQAYRQADVLLLPTYHPEGFPYVVIEAFRCGVPVIATAEGALVSLVKNGVTGYQVAARDPAAIVTVVEGILSQRGDLAGMSAHCHTLFNEQLSRTAAERYYSQLLDAIW